MGINNNWLDWMIGEAEDQAPTMAQNAPPSDPNQQMGQSPDQTLPMPQNDDNVEDDPTVPDQEEDKNPKDFEQWKHDFCELSIKGEVDEMLFAIGQMNKREGLEPAQRKFINDNLLILQYRQEANVVNATKRIRNLIMQDLDRTNPGTTVMQHLTAILEQDIFLQTALIKMTGLFGSKGEVHRKFIASLLGGIQVGGGGTHQDVTYFGKDYTINFSTRFFTQFGEINLGKWSLKTDDPSRYLSEPEQDRLEEGAPGEKQALRQRIMMESIGDKFKERAFLIHVVHPDGTIHAIGFDFGDSLLTAYKNGKLVLRGKQNSEKDAMISDTGEIIPLVDLDIKYVMETGDTDESGHPEMIEVPFIESRNKMLYLCADLQTLQTASSTLSGMFFRETPWNGNPSEIISISQSVPSLAELLNRKSAPL